MTDDVLKHIALELLSRGDPEQASRVLQAFSEAGIRVIFDLAVVDANDLGSLSLVQKRRLQIVQRLFLQQQQRQQQYDPTWWMNLRPEYLDSLIFQQEQEGQRQNSKNNKNNNVSTIQTIEMTLLSKQHPNDSNPIRLKNHTMPATMQKKEQVD